MTQAIELVADDLWKRIPSAPPGPFSKIGRTGNLFTADDGTTHYAVAERGPGDHVFCWFEGRERRDTAVLGASTSQIPVLDRQRRALVIGGKGGELFVVLPDGTAMSVARFPEGFRATRAAWTASGFAVIENELALHVYRWTPETPEVAPVGVGRYTEVPCGDIRRAGDTGDLLVAFDTNALEVLAIDDAGPGELRRLARFEVMWHTPFQCTDESGRHLWILPPEHVSDGGGQFRLQGLAAAWADRGSFPTVARHGELAPITPGDATAVAPPAVSAVVAAAAPGPRAPIGAHVRALMKMLAARDVGERVPPDDAVFELLALPMDDDLYAYLHYRATHANPGVVAIYEAWLDPQPRRVTSAYALGQGTDAIELGSLANGDVVVAVFGAPGERYHIAELSHEEDDARNYGTFTRWLEQVCMRTESATDLDPYLR